MYQMKISGIYRNNPALVPDLRRTNCRNINESSHVRLFLILFLFGLLAVSAVANVTSGNNAPESRADPLANETFSVEDISGNSVDTVHPKAGPYIFDITVRMYDNPNTISTTTLTIDPSGIDVSVQWDFKTNTIKETNDPEDYVAVVTENSFAQNPDSDSWQILLAVDFNWNFPDTAEATCVVESETFSSFKDTDMYFNAFAFKNDVRFNGDFKIEDSRGDIVEENSWVPALDTLTWKGITVIFEGTSGSPVYPQLSNVNYKLTEEKSGNFWFTSLGSGKELDISISTGTDTIHDAKYTLSLTNLPDGVELINNPSIVLNIDTEPVSFSSFIPVESTMPLNDTTVTCGVTLTDSGGSGVDPSTIEYAISIHGVLNYESWTDVAEEKITILNEGEKIEVSLEAIFINGDDNYIKWRATDYANNGDKNGFYESKDIQIKIDKEIGGNYAPIIALELPRNATVFNEDDLITFSALESYDPDGDLLSISWYSNISGLLSSEMYFQKQLEPGVHLITFSLDDGNGHLTSSDIEITVKAKEALPDSISNERGGGIFAPSTATTGTFTVIMIALLYFFGGTEIGKYKLLGIVIPFYSKLTRKMVLDHETRGIIRGYILANPGDHFTSIKKHIGVKNGTLAYHLKILERESIIKSTKDGIFKRFYPMNVKITPDMVHMSKQELILNTIIENPGVTRKELANKVGLSRQVVNYHSKGLIQSGLVRSEKYGKKIQYYPNEPMLTDINQ